MLSSARTLWLALFLIIATTSDAYAQVFTPPPPVPATVTKQQNHCSPEQMVHNMTTGQGTLDVSLDGQAAELKSASTPVLVSAPLSGTTIFQNVVGVYEVLPKGSTPVWTRSIYFFCPDVTSAQFPEYPDDVYYNYPQMVRKTVKSDGTITYETAGSACPVPKDREAMTRIVTGTKETDWTEIGGRWQLESPQNEDYRRIEVQYGVFMLGGGSLTLPIYDPLRQGAVPQHTRYPTRGGTWHCTSPNAQPADTGSEREMAR